VVLVEDNREAADMLKMLLELLGHEVAVAHSGPEGVELAAAFGPEVVLCDIGLPGYDGFEVARQLRGRPATAKALLVALTGYGAEEDRRRGLEAGFDEYLVKPADPAALESALARSPRTGP
jgi:two-component system CheB/CheR fusion protein